MEEQKLLKRKRKAEGNNSNLALACMDLADFYVSENRYTLAIKEYKIVAKIYKSENKLNNYAQINRGIGEAFMGLQQFEEARQHFEIYLKVSSEEKNAIEEQRALAQMGHMYLTWFLETASEPNTSLLNSAYSYFIKSLRKCESLTSINNLEKQDMIARLFSNLGLVKESLGEYDKALNLFNKSIKICLDNDIYEQLYRGYMALASLFEKQGMYNDTIRNFNLAIETAKKLSNKKVDLMCAALLAKSETLIKIADFNGAKQVLLKGYKLKTPNLNERKIIERNLRIVATMCYTEDKLVTCDDQRELKKYYEKMGDGACDLKNFSKAIEYYKKMLQASENSGASEKELASCYYSLAETYKDNNQYSEAEEYYEKEYALCKNNLKDNLNTLSRIADTRELAGASVTTVKEVYERAFKNCHIQKNYKEERRMVLRLMAYLRRMNAHAEICQMEKYLNNLQAGEYSDAESSSSDNESEDSESKAIVGDDICLSDITDLSDNSDNETAANEQESSVGKRKRQKNTKFQRNAKGEWPLHCACIKGEMRVVKHLVDSGHPINVRDNCGWLPLHEACSYGYCEIVELLIDNGAAINDRGGAQCDGVTPLHDAAVNGHLELVQLLLNRGASAVAKTDSGHTPLYELKSWRQRMQPSLSIEMEQLYNKLIERLSAALEKAGQKDEESARFCSSPEKENVYFSPQKLGRLRRNIEDEDDLGEEDQSSNSKLGKGASEYQQVMQTLRRKTTNKESRISPNHSKRTAFVNIEDGLSDDWLEDDMQASRPKRRKTDLTGKRERNSSKPPLVKQRPETSVLRRHTSEEDLIIPDEFFEDFEDTIIPVQEGSPQNKKYLFPDRRISNESASSSSSLKRKSQISLLDAGFSKRSSDTPPGIKRTNSSDSISSQRSKHQQKKLSNFGHTRTIVEADSTTNNCASQRSDTVAPTQTTLQNVVVDPTLFVDVKIEGRLFRVPVLCSQVQTRTIRWLAEEAATRYASKQCMKPSLELETANGAILADEDILSLLFPMGSTQAEQVVGRVVKWSLPPLIERYREACQQMSVDPEDSLCQLSEELSISLNLSDQGILSTSLSPFLKAISHQNTLSDLDLSGNFLNTDSVNTLCSSLATLSNLHTLNLSCTGLNVHHTSLLANVCATNSSVLQKLTYLDLSDNTLTDKSIKNIALLTANLNLNKMILCNVGFTENIFFGQNDVDLNLKAIHTLDISDNALNASCVKRFVSWTDLSILANLNVSRNKGGGILKCLMELFETAISPFALKQLNISRCLVEDSEIFELLRLSSNLKELDLSYNSTLTSISLRRLLEYSSLYNIDVIGCDNIMKYSEYCDAWELSFARGNSNKSVFRISTGSNKIDDSIVRAFQNAYASCVIEEVFGFLQIIVPGLH